MITNEEVSNGTPKESVETIIGPCENPATLTKKVESTAKSNFFINV